MKPEIHFTVIIPLYNKEPFIERALNSVLAQTYPQFEVIVIDDGSTDSGASLIAACQDGRVRLISQDNAGVSAARNRGIMEAKDEWVAFLDADDEWMPDILQKFSQAIQKKKEIDLCFSAYTRVTQLDTQRVGMIGPEEAIILDDYFSFEIQTGSHMWTSTVAVRRAMFEIAGMFPVGVQMAEDLDMWMRLALTSRKMAYIPRPLAYYDMRVAGACDTNKEAIKSGKQRPHYPRTFAVIENFTKENRLPDRLKHSTERWIESKMPLFLRDIGYGRGFAIALTLLSRHARKPGIFTKSVRAFLLGYLSSFDLFVSTARKTKKILC